MTSDHRVLFEVYRDGKVRHVVLADPATGGARRGKLMPVPEPGRPLMELWQLGEPLTLAEVRELARRSGDPQARPFRLAMGWNWRRLLRNAVVPARGKAGC